MNGHHGAVHFLVRNVAAANGFQLCRNGSFGSFQIFGFNAAVHLHERLALVEVCRTVVAKAHLFPHVGEQLGAGCAAEEHSHHFQGIPVGIAGFPAHDHFALVDRQGFPHGDRLRLAGAGGQERNGDRLPVGNGSESLPQGVRQLGNSFRSHKVDLDLCRPEQLLKCFVSSLRSHGFGRFAGAVAGKGSRFAGECGFVGLRNGVLPLLVDFRINAVQQVGLLNAELGFVECTVCHIRLKNAAQQDPGEFRKDSFVFQSIAVSNGRSPQGDDLYITHFGNAAAEICPVQHVQFAVHDRVRGIGFAAGGDQRTAQSAGSCVFLRQRLEELDPQRVGFEFGIQNFRKCNGI